MVGCQATNGITALHVAAKFGHLRAAALLLGAGALERVKSNAGDIPLGAVTLSDLEDEKDVDTENGTLWLPERGPAFRARSFLWPTADVATAVSKAVENKTVETLGRVPVRVFRRKRKSLKDLNLTAITFR